MKKSRRPENTGVCTVLFSLLLLWPGISSGDELGIFDTLRISARSRAMGTVSGPVADDASALYLNPAGLVLSRGIIVYGEYGDGGGEGSSTELRGIFVYPLGRLVLGGGYYRRRRQPEITGESLALGAAYTILDGAQGSFLSAGLNARMDRISRESESNCLPCGSSPDADNLFSIDLGIMLRPLPMVSLSYGITDLTESKVTTDYGSYELQLEQRWGVAWIWDNRLVIAWEHLTGGTGGADSFGFSLRTDSPIELMAGFSSEKVSGGVRWVQRRFDCLVSFSPVDDGDIFTSVSAQFYFRKKPDEIVQ